MVIIKASCPTCGEVDLKVDEIELTTSPDGESTYRFECPLCGDPVEKPADSRVVQLLISGGVTPLAGGREAVQAAPFTSDDLLDFHLLLRDEASFLKFLARLAA